MACMQGEPYFVRNVLYLPNTFLQSTEAKFTPTGDAKQRLMNPVGF